MNISAATANLLIVIWQVQAASVGLVFALAVFVFGLLQGRGRISYRAFLRRTMALPLATFNVASLLFNGMVLLGLGHQTPGTTSEPATGWAITEASLIALASMVTIVVILAGTMRAIDPATESAVQAEYRETALAIAVRSELLQDKAVELIIGKKLMGRKKPWARFRLAYSGPGQAVTFRRSSRGFVRNVSVWKLCVLSWMGSVFHRNPPVVQSWPGKQVTDLTPLLTIDLSCTRLERWWARWSVSVRVARSDLLVDSLRALYGDTLEHIRADRPTEAVAGLRALSGLQPLVWRAYTAHGRAYRPDQEGVSFRRGAGDQIDEFLDALLRAAALSRDPAIQTEASGLPRLMASEALYRQVPTAVRQALSKLESVYLVLAADLSAGGEHGLPVTQLARSRLDAPFGSLMSFVNFYLGDAIDQMASGGSTWWNRRPLPPFDFLFSQLGSANEAMLRLLRHAVQIGDTATALRALAIWEMPELPRARSAPNVQTSPDIATGSEILQPPRTLEQSLADAEADLNAMFLRLFVTVIDADPKQQQTSAADVHGSAEPDGDDGMSPHGTVAAAILSRFTDGSLWSVLETAFRTADADWTWQITDDEIQVSGRVTVRSIDTTGPLTQAFALAAIAHPALVAGTVPGQLAVDRGPSLISAARQVLASHKGWLKRQGCPPDTAARNAGRLQEQLTASQLATAGQLEREIRTSPVRDDVVADIEKLALKAFHEHDVAGVLFARAGKVGADGTGLSPVTVAINSDRRPFTSSENAQWAVDSLGQHLGVGLAALSLQLVSLTAAQDAHVRPSRRDDASGAVLEAIAELSGNHTAEAERRSDVSRIVILIPDLGYTDRNALGIERTVQNGSLAAAASTALQQFGLEEEGLASQVVGTINGVLVIETRLRDKNVVAVDLARFAQLHRNAPAGTTAAEPEFALYQAPDPDRLVTGGTQGSAVGTPPTLLQVQVSLSLAARIEVQDRSAVRVIRLE